MKPPETGAGWPRQGEGLWRVETLSVVSREIGAPDEDGTYFLTFEWMVKKNLGEKIEMTKNEEDLMKERTKEIHSLSRSCSHFIGHVSNYRLPPRYTNTY